MHGPLECEGKVTGRGFKRGTYEAIVRNWTCLREQDGGESKTFEIGGFEWRLAFFRSSWSLSPRNRIKAAVLSCNDIAISADVHLNFYRQRRAEDTPVQRKRRVALPFHFLERQFIDLDRLTDSNEKMGSDDTIIVVIDLKNIRAATADEKRKAACDMRTIHLEVIDAESINKRLNKGNTFGIVPRDRKRYADVCSYSLVHLWAEQSSDCRYWLCERSSDGTVVVKGCLNKAKQLLSFENICDESSGVPWVTVFREKKESHKEFEPIDENTMLLFCMLHDLLNEDHLYLGHFLVRRQMLCHELSDKIIEDLASLQESQKCSVHLGKSGWYIKDLTDETWSLAECGVHSGSVVIVKTQQAAGHLDSQDTDAHKNGNLNGSHDVEVEKADTDDRLQSLSYQEVCDNKRSSPQDPTSDSLMYDDRKATAETSQQLNKLPSPSVTEMQHSKVVVKADEPKEDLSVAAVKEMTAAVKDMQKEVLTEVCNELKRPLMEELQKVGKAVNGVATTVTASHEEICIANLMADVTMEQLSENDRESALIDRNGQEAFLIADEFVKGEPIFLLDYQKDYRMRVRLVHKHQSDASNFQIKYVSVQPSDGLELGLKVFEACPQSEGSEVVALFQFDKFQSVRLSSPSPQFGSIARRFVSLPITMGVETMSTKTAGHSLKFELKGRILCRLATGNVFVKLHSLKRYVLRSWSNLPQWMRDGARGAMILGSMAAGTSMRACQTMSFSEVLSFASSFLLPPCFRLNGMRVPTE